MHKQIKTINIRQGVERLQSLMTRVFISLLVTVKISQNILFSTVLYNLTKQILLMNRPDQLKIKLIILKSITESINRLVHHSLLNIKQKLEVR